MVLASVLFLFRRKAEAAKAPPKPARKAPPPRPAMPPGATTKPTPKAPTGTRSGPVANPPPKAAPKGAPPAVPAMIPRPPVPRSARPTPATPKAGMREPPAPDLANVWSELDGLVAQEPTEPEPPSWSPADRDLRELDDELAGPAQVHGRDRIDELLEELQRTEPQKAVIRPRPVAKKPLKRP